MRANYTDSYCLMLMADTMLYNGLKCDNVMFNRRIGCARGPVVLPAAAMSACVYRESNFICLFTFFRTLGVLG